MHVFYFCGKNAAHTDDMPTFYGIVIKKSTTTTTNLLKNHVSFAQNELTLAYTVCVCMVATNLLFEIEILKTLETEWTMIDFSIDRKLIHNRVKNYFNYNEGKEIN